MAHSDIANRVVARFVAVDPKDNAIGIKAGEDPRRDDFASRPPRQLLDDRLRQVAVRLRRLLIEVRARPQQPVHELTKRLQDVVDLAEQD